MRQHGAQGVALARLGAHPCPAERYSVAAQGASHPAGQWWSEPATVQLWAPTPRAVFTTSDSAQRRLVRRPRRGPTALTRRFTRRGYVAVRQSDTAWSDCSQNGWQSARSGWHAAWLSTVGRAGGQRVMPGAGRRLVELGEVTWLMTGPSAAALVCAFDGHTATGTSGQTSIASPKRTQAGSVAPVVRPGRPSPLVEAL